ncbi:hypothetical protein O3M35_011204 [Rhynocoris fuscipes]|uniref:C2H2-type domain-containing protein n=1 Tax=Rhynocoris fuscipes TaxID=488301 RepID=A0AAW1D0K9_9HEMI
MRFICDTCGKDYKYKAGLYAHKKHECGKEPSFRCPYCPFRAKYKSGLKAHIISKHANFERFACGSCDKTYKYKHHLKRHEKYECGMEPQFKCPHCDYKAKQKERLKTHVALKLIRKHVCDACGRAYKNKGHLSSHKKYECGVEPQFQCPHCPYRAKQKGSLKSHIGIKHNVMVEGRYACMKCGDKSYKNKKHLKRHQQYECGMEPQFQCPYCPYKAKQKDTLKAHIGFKHFFNAERYPCPGCEKTYKNKCHLRRHQKYECNKEPQFKCPRCPYRAKLRETLRNHIDGILLKGERIFMCDHCEKSYKHKRHLAAHKKYNCGIEPRFKCSLCDYKSKHRYALNGHIASLTTSGMFACSNCNKLYKYKCNLLRHIKYECDKEPQFKCQQCPYRAKRQCSFRRHQAMKHNPFSPVLDRFVNKMYF